MCVNVCVLELACVHVCVNVCVRVRGCVGGANVYVCVRLGVHV